MEDVAVLARERATGHVERRSTAICISRHRLVDHDRVVERGMTVALRVVRRQVTVSERDGVLALDAHAFGQVGHESRVGHVDVGGGVNRRRAEAVGRIGTAVNVDRAATTVGADRRRRSAGRGDGEVTSIHDTAAGGHDATRAAARRGDGHVAHIDRRTVALAAIVASVATVREDAVGAVCVRLDRAPVNGGRRTAHHEQASIQPVEVAVVTAVRVARFRNCDV